MKQHRSIEDAAIAAANESAQYCSQCGEDRSWPAEMRTTKMMQCASCRAYLHALQARSRRTGKRLRTGDGRAVLIALGRMLGLPEEDLK